MALASHFEAGEEAVDLQIVMAGDCNTSADENHEHPIVADGIHTVQDVVVADAAAGQTVNTTTVAAESAAAALLDLLLEM